MSVCSSRELMDIALLARVGIVSELLAQVRGPVRDRHGVLAEDHFQDMTSMVAVNA